VKGGASWAGRSSARRNEAQPDLPRLFSFAELLQLLDPPPIARLRLLECVDGPVSARAEFSGRALKFRNLA
jgi:hypothetical protein